MKKKNVRKFSYIVILLVIFPYRAASQKKVMKGKKKERRIEKTSLVN